MSIPFEEVSRLPFPDDNVAIATCDLDAGVSLVKDGKQIVLSHSVLEGHRFAVVSIEKGSELYSWGMPFGKATEHIRPGMYVCNEGVLNALNGRDIQIDLPDTYNFSDTIPQFVFDADAHTPGPDPQVKTKKHFFEGYGRGDARGVGTRNYIVILGISSRVAGFVRQLEKKCNHFADAYDNVDGIVGVVHTEGDDASINNRDLVVRTLAGFVVHPNTGAVLLVDDGSEAITYSEVISFMEANKYPYKGILHASISLGGSFQKPLENGESHIKRWLEMVNANTRMLHPISELKIALQCGGSDAFSGISGNPLASWVAREIIEQGGCANLAETDELLGAEGYILKNVRSHDTALKFLACIDQFVKRAERHGSSAAGNPSGGNKFRGLYNIYLKSIGAAMKKHPEVRLDEVIAYGDLMTESGFYFMG